MVNKFGPFGMPDPSKPWAPAIPNTVDEAPRVGDIRAEKLGFLELPDGKKFWAAIKGDFYSEVMPYKDTGGCDKSVEGCYGIDTSFHPIPDGSKFLRKELNEWYLEVRPAPNCRPKKGTWDLEPV